MLKAIAALIVIIALTGCDVSYNSSKASKNEAHHTTTKPSPSLSKSGDESIREIIYLRLVHHKIPITKVMPDAKLISLGKQNCKTLEGLPLRNATQLRLYTVSFHSKVAKFMTLGQTGWYMGVTIGAFCPQYDHIIQGG